MIFLCHLPAGKNGIFVKCDYLASLSMLLHEPEHLEAPKHPTSLAHPIHRFPLQDLSRPCPARSLHRPQRPVTNTASTSTEYNARHCHYMTIYNIHPRSQSYKCSKSKPRGAMQCYVLFPPGHACMLSVRPVRPNLFTYQTKETNLCCFIRIFLYCTNAVLPISPSIPRGSHQRAGPMPEP